MKEIHFRYYKEYGKPNGPDSEDIKNKSVSKITGSNLFKNTSLNEEQINEMVEDLAVTSVYNTSSKPNKEINEKLGVNIGIKKEEDVDKEVEERRDLLIGIFKK